MIAQYEQKFLAHVRNCSGAEIKKMVYRADIPRQLGFDPIPYTSIRVLRKALYRKYIFGMFVVLMKHIPADVMHYLGAFFDYHTMLREAYLRRYISVVRETYGVMPSEAQYWVGYELIRMPTRKYREKQVALTQEIEEEVVTRLDYLYRLDWPYKEEGDLDYKEEDWHHEEYEDELSEYEYSDEE